MAESTLDMLHKYRSIITLISSTSIISFFISNLIIFYVMTTYFDTRLLYKVGIFIMGFIISSMILKSDYFIKTKPTSIKDKINLFKSFIFSNKPRKIISQFNIYIPSDKINFIFIIIKSIFFNTLNDLFLVLVIWLFYTLALYKLFTAEFTAPNFQSFVGIITLIGIVAGIFQYYLTNYKEEQLPKTLQPISNLFIDYVKKYSFKEFYNFCKSGKPENQKIYTHIRTALIGDKKIPGIDMYLDARRPGKEINEITYNLTPSNEAFLFTLIDLYLPEIDEKNLQNAYRDFFQDKDKEIQGAIHELDLSKYKKLLLSNFIFFNEMIMDLIEVDIEMDSEPKELKSYQDFLTESINNNVFYLLDEIMYQKQLPTKGKKDIERKIADAYLSEKEEKPITVKNAKPKK